MTTAYLFAGQGSQKPGMLHELPESQTVKETIEEACCILGEDVLTLDTEGSLASTRAVQLALLIQGVALTRRLSKEGVFADIAAGHSIGAFTAAVACGALSFPQAVLAVDLRGRLMESAYPDGYGMGVITGLRESQVVMLTEKINSPSMPVYPANFNAEDQITVTGSLRALEQVFSLALAQGAFLAKFIRVSIPSHCRLMASVSEELENKLSAMEWKEPVIPYVGNCRARVLQRAEEMKEDLYRAVARPVRWHEATSLMFEKGVRLFVEIGPGEVLTNLAGRAFPEARCISVMGSGMDSAVLLMKQAGKCG